MFLVIFCEAESKQPGRQSPQQASDSCTASLHGQHRVMGSTGSWLQQTPTMLVTFLLPACVFTELPVARCFVHELPVASFMSCPLLLQAELARRLRKRVLGLCFDVDGLSRLPATCVCWSRKTQQHVARSMSLHHSAEVPVDFPFGNSHFETACSPCWLSMSGGCPRRTEASVKFVPAQLHRDAETSPRTR